MRIPAQRLVQVARRAAGVLLAAALLAQHVPVGPLAQQGHPMHHECNEEVCQCGPACPHHGGGHAASSHAHGGSHAASGPASSHDAGARGDRADAAPSLRSCGAPSQDAAGALFVSKSLLLAAQRAGVAPRVAEKAAPQPPAWLASQYRGDGLFRPPKPRIG